MSHDGVGLRAVMRAVAFLTAGALAVPALAGCSTKDPAGKPLAEPDVAPVARAMVADGGSLSWAVDSVPETLNTFQADADGTTTRVAQAVLPSMYRLDANGRPQVSPDYLEKAEVVETEPKQVVLYKLNQQAVWSDGREIGAADFAAQWRALSGKDTAYWTARNAGYDRIERIERGKNDLEVKVTFERPYADWKSLFSPLYPKDVMGTPDSFNDGARKKLKVTAGPYRLKEVDRKDDEVTLDRNPRWWGHPAKLDEIVLRAVPREERAAALAAGKLDLAEIDPESVKRITVAAGPRRGASSTPLMGPGSDLGAADSLRSWAVANGSDEEAADDEISAREKQRTAVTTYARQQQALRGFEVRRSLEPAYTQLALNGADGPLADERVRRAVARALDREALASVVLTPLGLPAEPVGSHLALSGQAAYADNSGALGGQDTAEAQALLTDAGWVRGGPLKEEKKKEEKAAGAEGEKAREKSEDGDDDTYIVGEDDKARREADREKKKDPKHLAQDGKQYANKLKQGGAPGAYAPRGTAAPAGTAAGALAKDGKPLTLRFVLPSGPGSQTLGTVADRISGMLRKVGIRTEISKVEDESYFKDHIASGQYDLALYSWPASAFPATDGRPIYAKPVPAADGSLNVEQNYTRVGTDQVDQLFDQAVATLDERESRGLIRKADSRIWAAAGSIPLYQRPQLTAARKNVVNAGAFGFGTPVYEDMGFLKKGARPAASPTAK
ncbi:MULTISPECIES: ABC transporter family substrate-binding protein [unclassified Streptomyces]|uniref:ABC transporter family substrate-binding protein n=1 Tax=unclassified Streptomyces TaxID=2593676 RepID=UPI002255A94D|nr:MULTISPECIES: ABC transporter family substrate-binding protein [unclassified Streptomyces]MCX5331584.1 ABC transporter family substrate-binding protein [Streptomyces sp. NBC_00140]MCX5360978.1 ABC transporter family substrate-binding protein [Streptomyces sp. NBC_00124]